MYEIEKNIPVAKNKFFRPFKYPFESMEIGDSFAFERSKGNSVSGCAYAYGKRRNKKFKVSKSLKRCWRIA